MTTEVWNYTLSPAETQDVEHPQSVKQEGFVPTNFFSQILSKVKSCDGEDSSAEAASLAIYSSAQRLSEPAAAVSLNSNKSLHKVRSPWPGWDLMHAGMYDNPPPKSWAAPPSKRPEPKAEPKAAPPKAAQPSAMKHLMSNRAAPPSGPTARSAHDTALVTAIFSFGTAVVSGLLALSHLDGLRPTMSRLESATALMLVLFALIAFGLSVTVSTYDNDELTTQGKGMSYSSTVFAAAAVATIAGVLVYVKFVDQSAIKAFPWTLVGVMVAMLIAGILSAVTTSQAVR